MSDHLYPVQPDFSQTNDNILTSPTEGQFWYNTSNKHMYFWRGDQWIPMMNRNDYAANWGQLSHGQSLPKPQTEDGYIFDYDECIWSTSPAVLGKFDNFVCFADSDGVVTARYRPVGTNTFIDGIANYIIVGIRGNHNRGIIIAPPFPSPTPTVTPTIGSSPTPTPTPTQSVPVVTSTPTPTISATVGITPTPTRTPTPTPAVTPTVTPSTSAVPPMTVQIDDPQGLTNASLLSSYCNIANYTSTKDSGYSGCAASTITLCPTTNSCAPEPGDNGAGPVMRVTVSGGAAPYTVRLRNFQNSSAFNVYNSDFELGDVGWTKQSGWTITSAGIRYDGSWSAKFNGGSSASLTSQAVPITPNRVVTAAARIYLTTASTPSSARIILEWYNSSMAPISFTSGTLINSGAGTWQLSTVSGAAPAGAAFVAISISANKNFAQGTIYADAITWNLGNSGTPECFFVGGASIPSIPFAGVAKTYSVSLSGQSTPIISLDGICSSAIFSMAGTFDVEVTDSIGTVQTITKNWEIFRINEATSGGGGGGGGGGDIEVPPPEPV